MNIRKNDENKGDIFVSWGTYYYFTIIVDRKNKFTYFISTYVINFQNFYII